MGLQRKEPKKRVDPRLILWAWGSLEADFWRYYKMNLTEEGFSNRLSWRKFLIFVKGLPSDSAFQRWLSDKDNRNFAEWSEEAIDEGIRKKPKRKGGR
jgi:hypothetical protein